MTPMCIQKRQSRIVQNLFLKNVLACAHIHEMELCRQRQRWKMSIKWTYQKILFEVVLLRCLGWVFELQKAPQKIARLSLWKDLIRMRWRLGPLSFAVFGAVQIVRTCTDIQFTQVLIRARPYQSLEEGT